MEFRSWFVRGGGGRRFLCTVPTVLQYSTVLLYMCSKQKHKAGHGHKKGLTPRAQELHSSTGISRPRTEVLRSRTYSSAANTLLRSRASRGHLNLYCAYSLHSQFTIQALHQRRAALERLTSLTWLSWSPVLEA